MKVGVNTLNMYNDWFINFAPEAFRNTRIRTTRDVEHTLKITENLTNVSIDILEENPSVLPTLRMSTCPPIAVDRLIGLAGVSNNLVHSMKRENCRRACPNKSLETSLNKSPHH